MTSIFSFGLKRKALRKQLFSWVLILYFSRAERPVCSNSLIFLNISWVFIGFWVILRICGVVFFGFLVIFLVFLTFFVIFLTFLGFFSIFLGFFGGGGASFLGFGSSMRGAGSGSGFGSGGGVAMLTETPLISNSGRISNFFRPKKMVKTIKKWKDNE